MGDQKKGGKKSGGGGGRGQGSGKSGKGGGGKSGKGGGGGKAGKGISNNCPGVWCDPCFILKVIAVVLLIVVVILANVEDGTYTCGRNSDAARAAQWCFILACAGGTFILLVLIVGYSFASVPQLVDVIFVFVLFILCLASGAVAVYCSEGDEWRDNTKNEDVGLAVGALLIIAAIALLLDGILNLLGMGGAG